MAEQEVRAWLHLTQRALTQAKEHFERGEYRQAEAALAQVPESAKEALRFMVDMRQVTPLNTNSASR